ncbi:conserved hypothetical protein [Leishmania major strain Friedlin]|uniref:Uncharacterized protein n=1 Tax=Leishmania major TaxID=5664 RepID=E9ADD1_LEIMA|nr:conserved hypothetical protein [Leishmania major strain Friedlin]CAG9576759.1 hypothetical_protein_-_conserved [Leishmania major strain Friedlin]CBZ12219.1 conserved hypothetical protein [Leishmania major strain Friedlin]|eukprot:XP_003721960.1 conserved hypothetical protein [Leishmania major strain Friedlin]
MPSVGSGYTFADFLQRLERSPASQMPLLYHEHRLLFVNRPDMLSRAVLSVSWERGLTILQAAYYTQPVAAETYRALLARMLRHNRHVSKTGAGQLVSWQAAIKVMSEAVLAHGTSLPTRVSVSTLRLLAPHRQWRTAIDVLKLNQANGQLTKPMLVDAAHACATSAAWPHALQLLMHLHQQDPPLLFDAIQSMRPPGTTTLTAAASAHALLPSVRDGGAPTPAQQHILSVLNSVVGSVPHEVAARSPLCTSYLTHLLASTTLAPELKVQRATAAMAQLPWTAALALLSDLSEPALLTDAEWTRVRDTVVLPSNSDVGKGDGGSGVGEERQRRRPLSAKRRPKRERDASSVVTLPDAVEPEKDEEAAEGAVPSSFTSLNASISPSAPSVTSAAASHPHQDTAVLSTAVLFSRMQLLRASPLTAAAMIAVIVEKLPTPEMAAAFLQSCAAHLAQPVPAPSSAPDALDTALHGGGPTVGSVAAARHPVVVHALLRNCARHENGWAIAAPALLGHSAAQATTPPELLSSLVRQLRQAKQVALAVRLLHEHIIPSGSLLTPTSWEDMLECTLAHNRAIRLRHLQRKRGNSRDGSVAAKAAPRLSSVHWVSALSWVKNRQTTSSEDRICKTGTGPSQGATQRHPLEVVALERPLSHKTLSLLINVCVLGGSPQGALHVLGYARRVNKTELPCTSQIRALLYCMQYDRPCEAEAIVEQCAKREGEAAAQPLRHLLRLIGEGKSNDDEGDEG